MNMERLREKLINKYYPSEEEIEEIKERYDQISGFIEEEFSVETHFAGSAGRETCMKGDKDIDIFLLLEENLDRKELEDRGLTVGKKVFQKFDGEYQINYAEHPYVKGEIKGHEVEIVPCYDTSPEDIKSSVDRSPHHSRWVRENLSEEQKKDVVILKRFLTANQIYGSSLKTRGFSGYLCEILISRYGSFENLVQNAREWKEETVIDTENHHEGNLPESLKKKFKDEQLIVIDPVDPERNVASVLSEENFAKFIYESWKFTEDPGINYFEEKEPGFTGFEIKQEIKKRADFKVLEFEAPDEVDDIIYPQMRKTLRRLEKLVKKHDFRIYNSGFHIGEKARIFFELESTLPQVEEVKGPKVFHGSEHLEQFVSKYDNVFIKNSRLVAKTGREYTEVRELFQDFLEDDLEEKGIPSNVAEEMEDFNFTKPVNDDEKWLNYLGKKLNIDKNN